jgi:hypothetical protein
VDISKARVLEVFMKHHRTIQDEDERRRALRAANDTQDEFVPWREDLSEDERSRLDTVCAYVNEILDQDFGIRVVSGTKLTPVQKEGAGVGGMAAIEWLKTNAERVPPLEKMEENRKAWGDMVNHWAFELVPSDRASDKEWVNGFIMGFTGDIFRHIQGLPLIGAGWNRPDPHN